MEKNKTIIKRIPIELDEWIKKQQEKTTEHIGWDVGEESYVRSAKIIAKKIEENRISFGL